MSDPVAFETYVETVADRLAERGYERVDDGPEGYRTATFRDRGVSISKFGLVDYFCVLGEFVDPSVPAVEEFTDRTFAFACDRGGQWPLGIGRSVVAFPVAACRSPSENLVRGIAEYRPTHWGGFEFPVVADLGEGTVHYYSDTPTWRRRTYARFRRLAADAFDPDDADLDEL